MMKDRIRYFNKYVLNHLLGRFARLSVGPFALVRHTGRKSGKAYETPIMAFPIPGGFLIALTYGPKVDWYQNVQAAGGCQLVWHGHEYTIDRLKSVAPAVAMPLFPRPQRTILRSLGRVHDFVEMMCASNCH